MNKEKDEEFDKLFKKGLEDPVNEAAFRDADWDAMEQMLDKGKKRSAIVYWLPILGAAAALAILFLGYLFLNPDVVKPGKKNQVAAAHPVDTGARGKTGEQVQNNTGASGEPARHAADSGKQKIRTAQYAVSPPAHQGHGQNGKSFFPLSSGKSRRDAAGNDINSTTDAFGNNNDHTAIAHNSSSGKSVIGKTGEHAGLGHADEKANANENNNNLVDNSASGKTDRGKTDDHVGIGHADDKTDAKDNNSLADNTASGKITTDDHVGIGHADDKDKQKQNIAANTSAKADSGNKTKVKGLRKSSPNRPVFALGILASSDLNGVNSALQQSKVGGNFGATIAVTFAKKWTISTGATYDIKPYLTGFNNYHTSYQFKNNPSSVNANCKMLDIPINLNYQVYRQRANTLTLGTGLSSYLMLREDYQFNYDDPYNTGPAHYTVKNKNRNILSVLNLDATYTHQINSKVGVTVQPYLKVPLSNVGASQVRLQSTGVALGLSWNINTASKPK